MKEVDLQPSHSWTRKAIGVDLNDGLPILIAATRSHGKIKYSTTSVSAASEDRTSTIASALQARDSLTRWVDSPIKHPAKARRSMPSVLDANIPIALEDAQFSFVEQSRQETGTRALAVVAANTAIQAHIEHLDKSKLDPKVVDQEGLALWTQVVTEKIAQANGSTVIIHLALQHATIVLGHNRKFLSSHTLTSDDHQRIVRLINSRLPSDGNPINWVWTGFGCTSEMRLNTLRTALDSALPDGNHQVLPAPETFLPRALATRALTQGPLRVNLRGGTLTHPDLAAKSGARSAQPAMTCLAAGLMLCACSFGTAHILSEKSSAATEAFKESAKDVLGDSRNNAKGKQILADVEAEIQAQQSSTEPLARIRTPHLSPALRNILAEAKRLNVTVHTLDADAEAFRMTGVCEDWDFVDTLAEEVAKHGWKPTIKRTEVPSEDRIRYTITSESNK